MTRQRFVKNRYLGQREQWKKQVYPLFLSTGTLSISTLQNHFSSIVCPNLIRFSIKPKNKESHNNNIRSHSFVTQKKKGIPTEGNRSHKYNLFLSLSKRNDTQLRHKPALFAKGPVASSTLSPEKVAELSQV